MASRVVSGIQPSGNLHLGNYLGAIRPQLELQHEHPREALYFIADFHALTSMRDADRLREYVFDAAAAYLALGLDPEKALLFRQSDVPEVTELAWLLATVTGMGILERSPSYKDKINNGASPSVGLFYYPLLMAADILAYKATLVPVGRDQLPHLDLAQDVATHWSREYGEGLVRPEPLTALPVVVPGLDGRKMSKSYGNTIPLFAWAKVWDIESLQAAQDLLRHFAPTEVAEDRETCVHRLHAHLERQFAQATDRFEALHTPLWRDYVEDILQTSGRKARALAKETLLQCRAACGLRA